MHAALHNMKNNKSPGPDGFSVEFYTLFVLDIGMFLVRFVNYGFNYEEFSVTRSKVSSRVYPRIKT